MNLRPLQDVIIVELEQHRTETKGGIIIPDTWPSKLRVGKVLARGPGTWKWNSRTEERWFQATQVEIGERVVFLEAIMDTKQGRQLCHYVGENKGLIREIDILFVIPAGEEIEVSA